MLVVRIISKSNHCLRRSTTKETITQRRIPTQPILIIKFIIAPGDPLITPII